MFGGSEFVVRFGVRGQGSEFVVRVRRTPPTPEPRTPNLKFVQYPAILSTTLSSG